MCNFFYLIGMVSYSFDGRVFFEDFNKGVYIGRIILFPSMLDTYPNRIHFFNLIIIRMLKSIWCIHLL